MVVCFSTDSSFREQKDADSIRLWHNDAEHVPGGVHLITAADSPPSLSLGPLAAELLVVRRLISRVSHPMKATLQSVVPLIPTGGGLAEALTFYTDHMGFSVVWQNAGMAGIRRDGIAFNLVANDNRSWADNASFSIGVSNLEELYREYREIPARVGPLEVKSWGRREFHMIVPSGVCLQFYEHEVA